MTFTKLYIVHILMYIKAYKVDYTYLQYPLRLVVHLRAY
jgi:hypothetical protein